MHLGDGSFYVLGFSFVSVQTIFPIFIKELGGNSIAIGSVQILWLLGMNIPAALVAQHLHRRTLFKSEMVKWGFVHRFMLFVSGVLAFVVIGRVSSDISVILFLLLLLLMAVFGSTAGLPWFQVFTKTVPITLRGRLLGIRQLLGSGAGAVGGIMVAIILGTVTFPLNFAILFFAAFFFMMISLKYLSKVNERPSEIKETEQYHRSIIAKAKNIIRTDKNFRLFLWVDAFAIMSISASSFYSVYAIEKFSLPVSFAGTFTAIVMVTNVVANIAFGIIGDSYGHRVNLLALAFASAMASLFAIVSPNIFMYGFVFFFLACLTQIQSISRLSFIAEMCEENDRPAYIGIINTITAPTVCAGLLFGWLVPKIGYISIFSITALLAMCSFVILMKFVAEPRNKVTVRRA